MKKWYIVTFVMPNGNEGQRVLPSKEDAEKFLEQCIAQGAIAQIKGDGY
jgi:hypothetical protein